MEKSIEKAIHFPKCWINHCNPKIQPKQNSSLLAEAPRQNNVTPRICKNYIAAIILRCFLAKAQFRFAET
jgi:hypothetical protein